MKSRKNLIRVGVWLEKLDAEPRAVREKIF